MDTKIINWKEEFTKLFPECTERKLADNHKWCEKCSGLGFFRKGQFIEFCNACRGCGQIELCTEKCGSEQQNHYTVCDICRAKKDFEKDSAREKELFEKAQKFKFADYDGMFLDNERAIDKDEFADNLYWKIKKGEDFPLYVNGTESRHVLSVDMQDVINNACDDGYEDMSNCLDWDGVNEIQELVDKWIEKQGTANLCYEETSKIVVLLDDLIIECKKQIAKENAATATYNLIS